MVSDVLSAGEGGPAGGMEDVSDSSGGDWRMLDVETEGISGGTADGSSE